MTDRPDLSRKLYHTIGEVAELTGVKPHVLRYWETEFSLLRPRKDRSGARRYRRGDVELVLEIRDLLHGEGYRIAGARQVLQDRRRRRGGAARGEPRGDQLALGFDQLDRGAQLAEIRRELGEVLDLVRGLGRGRRTDAAEG